MKRQLLLIWQQLQAQPRALAGAGLLVALAWLAWLLDADAQRVAAQQQLATQQQQLQRLQGFAGEQQWLQALQAGQTALAQVRQRLWREESEGRIQAHLQDWLRQQAEKSGLRVRELVVSLPQRPGQEEATAAPAEPVSGAALAPDLRLVQAQLTLEFDSAALATFLTEISSQERWLWLQRLQVQSQANRHVAELELQALFSVGAQDPNADNEEGGQ